MAKSKSVFVIPSDLPIGSLFKFSGSDVVYVVRKAKEPDGLFGYCDGCAFLHEDLCVDPWISCGGADRQDKKNVIFKKVKPKNDAKSKG